MTFMTTSTAQFGIENYFNVSSTNTWLFCESKCETFSYFGKVILICDWMSDIGQKKPKSYF